MTRDVGGSVFLAPFALCLLQGDPRGDGAALESVLQNDAFLRVAEESLASLREGDRALAELEGNEGLDEGERERLLSRAFESWHSALQESRTGDAVPPRPMGDDDTFRRTVDPCYAVLERLVDLRERRGSETLEAWTRRFGAVAEEAREAAGRETTALAEIERRYPATEAATWAALHLAEAAFEQGRVILALDWTSRAERHSALLPRDDSREAAIGDRRALFGGMVGTEDEERSRAIDAAWSAATALTLVQFTPIPDPVLDLALVPDVGPGRGLRPGICRVGLDRVAIQTATRVFFLHAESGLMDGVFEPERLFDDLDWETATISARRQAPGWPLLPASDGEWLYLVHGATEGERANALIAVGPPQREVKGVAVTPLPELRWAVRGDQRLDADGRFEEIPELAELAPFEFQPGPCIRGGLVFCQIWQRLATEATADRRFQSGGEVRAFAAAFHAHSGELAWVRFLAKGVERGPSAARLAGSGARPSAGMPQVPLATGVLFGTHLGTCALLEAADGRVAWNLMTRRVASDEPGGWSGPPPVALEDGTGALVAPADSDHLYWLRADPILASHGGSPFLRPPLPQGEAQHLIGGDRQEVWVLGRAGPRPAVFSISAETGARFDSIHLATHEAFTGPGLSFSERVLATTDRGVYLLDRSRELYLLDCAPLEVPEGAEIGMPRGGRLLATEERLFVVGPRTVWVFAAR